MNEFKNPYFIEDKNTPKRMRKRITVWLRSYDMREALARQGIVEQSTFIPASTAALPGYIPVVIWVDDGWAPCSSSEVRRVGHMVKDEDENA